MDSMDESRAEMEGDQTWGKINQGGGGEHQQLLDLPPGFRFHPTDEEIITHYLANKVVDRRFSACAMGEADLNKCEPWELPKRAKMGEKEWYFFVQKDRKYPTGMRTNRATERGYWKATGKDKEILRGKSGVVGMKKTLVFYKGRAPKGEKTNWVMHEFRLQGKLASRDEWVVCKVFHKSVEIRKEIHPNCQLSEYEYFVGYGGGGGPIIRGPAAETSLKPEPFSSIVSPSQDTMFSADANGEITSGALSGYQFQASGRYAYQDTDILEYSWD